MRLTVKSFCRAILAVVVLLNPACDYAGEKSVLDDINARNVDAVRIGLGLPETISDSDILEFFDSATERFGRLRDAKTPLEHKTLESRRGAFTELVAEIHHPHWVGPKTLPANQFINYIFGINGTQGMHIFRVELTSEGNMMLRGIEIYSTPLKRSSDMTG